jgi:coproporphyrinogen III oxidase-like Fe-S oxidoreductase
MIKYKKSFEELQQDVEFFQDFLRKRGSYYNVSGLYSLPEYDRKYSLAEIRRNWNNFISLNKGKDVLKNIDFYIHVPFCWSRCSYCSFPSQILKDEKDRDRYLKKIIENFNFFSNVFKGIEFRNLYIGGGTPNIFTEEQLRVFLSALFKNFKFNLTKWRTGTVEFNPNIGGLEKLDLLKEFGFNRVSFGVQSLDEATLFKNNRLPQTYENIQKAVFAAKKAGFKSINVDLIAGFASDTQQTFFDTFSQVAKLRPTGIVIYGLYPPNDNYLKEHFNLNRNEYCDTYYPKTISHFLAKVYEESEKLGYLAKPFDLSDFHWEFRNILNLKNEKLFGKEYGGEFSGFLPASTFGLGPFSRSRIYKTAEYQCSGVVNFFDDDKALFSGRSLNIGDEIIRFVIGSLEKKSAISPKLFQKTFNKGFEDVFPYAIYALNKLGKMKKKNGLFYFYFEKPEEKYIFGSFFVYEAIIRSKVDK